MRRGVALPLCHSATLPRGTLGFGETIIDPSGRGGGEGFACGESDGGGGHGETDIRR